MAKQTKKQQVVAKLDREKLYTVSEALATLRAHASKFDETVEVAMNLGVDPRHADQMVRGMVSLPSGTGKDVRVAVFARGDNAEKALAAGADKVGAEDLLEDMQNGNLNYDRVIASPDMMGVVGPLGKILGPRGLMPSPRAGTVTQDVASAVREYKAGKVEFRVDSGGNVHCVVGRLSFSQENLVENAEALLKYIRSLKPSTSKGQYIRNVAIGATMTPSITVAV